MHFPKIFRGHRDILRAQVPQLLHKVFVVCHFGLHALQSHLDLRLHRIGVPGDPVQLLRHAQELVPERSNLRSRVGQEPGALLLPQLQLLDVGIMPARLPLLHLPHQNLVLAPEALGRLDLQPELRDLVLRLDEGLAQSPDALFDHLGPPPHPPRRVLRHLLRHLGPPLRRPHPLEQLRSMRHSLLARC